jgi:ribosome-associated translation inhibitor RaiA
MRVQLKTDRHIAAHDELAHQVETVMEGAVGRFADRITRVEVHLSDENSHKGGGDDKRCLLEARLAGLEPMAVSHQAATLPQAIDGAAQKLARALEVLWGGEATRKGVPPPGETSIAEPSGGQRGRRVPAVYRRIPPVVQ